jgi:hypothetical protein
VRRSFALVLVLAAAGCGARAGTGPSWPKSAGTEVDPDLVAEDGGESLEPRREAVASVEASAEAVPEPVKTVDPALPAETAIEPKPDTPPVTPPPTGEDPPIVEEIVIEISD